MKTPGSVELKRFALHVLFGAVALALSAAIADLGRLHLDATTAAVVTALGTSAAAFFKREADANDAPAA